MKLIQWLGKVILAGILSLLLLSGFVLIYDYNGTHIENPSGATDYKWKPGQFHGNMIESISAMRTNGEGFSNSFESSDREWTDVLFMGSSHIAALYLPLEKNVSEILNRDLNGKTVYNIGMPGHFTDRIVKNLSAAIRAYGPKDAIIAEVETIAPDENSMKAVLAGTSEKLPSYDHGMVYRIQTLFPALQTIRKQAQNWFNQSNGIQTEAEMNQEVEPGYAEAPSQDDTLHDFLAYAKDSCGDIPLILVYHPTMLLDESGNAVSEEDPAALESFREACEAEDILFVDLTEDYEKLYTEEHKLPHGFFNTGFGVGHLNADGHRVMAERLSRVLEDLYHDAH